MPVAALDISLTDAAILIGVVVFALTKLAELRGWTRSPALVRQENADLRERNATLEAEVRRLDESDRDKAKQIAALEARVEELQKRDQAAVLEAISNHDSSMVLMGRAITESITAHEAAARDRSLIFTTQHEDAMVVWREIRDSLKGDT